MKKLFLIIPLVFLLCFAFACEKEDDDAVEEAMEMQALTDVQIVEIEDTLKKNYEEFITVMMDMNVDGMLAYYSVTDFREILLGTTAYTSLDSFKNMIIEMMEVRESHARENVGIKVTILSQDSAYVSAAYDYTINYKDGRIYKGKAVQTCVWEKETEGWKMTHDHVSWAGEFLEE